MNLAMIYFFLGAAACLVGLAGLLATRNVVRAAFFLLAVLVGVAFCFVAYSAFFLAAVQLLVYVGGILVLIIFAVMLARRDPQSNLIPLATANNLLGGAIGLSAFAGLAWLAAKLSPSLPERSAKPLREQHLQKIGEQLLGPQAFLFELAGVLLLISLIGASLVAFQINRENLQKPPQ